jgi:hypothetical protein
MFNNGWFQIDGNFMYPSKEFVDMLRTCKKLGIEFEDGYVDLMLEDYEVMLLTQYSSYRHLSCKRDFLANFSESITEKLHEI